MSWQGAGVWLAGGPDPALPADSPRKVDSTATPGSVSVAAGVRSIRMRFTVGNSEELITHPGITVTSHVVCSYEGNATSSPEATRRVSARPVAGGIVVSISGGAVAADGPVVVQVVAL